MPDSIYNFQLKTLKGLNLDLETYRDKALLIVNTASKCGLTPQYKGLEALYQAYKEQGFEILGFPCNQFGQQEPGSAEDISQFCQLNYGVSFPMLEKIDVNGANTHPLFKYLKSEARGLLGSQEIKWNFTKFLVDKQGNVIKRFAPTDTPASIERTLKQYL